eukprot:1389942-Prymnesium_polylepis.2
MPSISPCSPCGTRSCARRRAFSAWRRSSAWAAVVDRSSQDDAPSVTANREPPAAAIGTPQQRTVRHIPAAGNSKANREFISLLEYPRWGSQTQQFTAPPNTHGTHPRAEE